MIGKCSVAYLNKALPGFLFLLGEFGGLSEAVRFRGEFPITIASSASSIVSWNNEAKNKKNFYPRDTFKYLEWKEILKIHRQARFKKKINQNNAYKIGILYVDDPN